ncbi:MAG: hypothetical protein ABIN55_09025 [Aeromicrobium sp.]
MTGEHKEHKPPAKFSYAVGAGLGMLVGGAIGLFMGHFLLDAAFGIAIGLVVAFLVRELKP